MAWFKHDPAPTRDPISPDREAKPVNLSTRWGAWFAKLDKLLAELFVLPVILKTTADATAVTFEADGTMVFSGDAVVWDDLRVEPNVRGTGANNPTLDQFFTDGLGSKGVYLYAFTDVAAAQEKEIFFTVQLPHAWKGTAVDPHVHWVGNSSDTVATPRWGLEYTWANIGSVFANSQIIYATGNINGAGTTDPDITAGKHYISEFAALTPSASQDGISSVLICRLFRNSSDAADTYNVGGNKCGLLYVDFHYEIDTLGSRTEYTK